MEDKKREKFYQVYADLPLGIRDQIVVVVDDEPMTWRALKLEVDNNTQAGKKGIQKLFSLGILNSED